MAVTGISANRAELLQIADAVAREKMIEKEVVIAAILFPSCDGFFFSNGFGKEY